MPNTTQTLHSGLPVDGYGASKRQTSKSCKASPRSADCYSPPSHRLFFVLQGTHAFATRVADLLNARPDSPTTCESSSEGGWDSCRAALPLRPSSVS